MAAEELQHVALPMLFGAPAYARPTAPMTKIDRPFDPDDLPLQAVMTDEERTGLERGPGPTLMPAEIETESDERRRARGFGIRGLTGLLRSRGD